MDAFGDDFEAVPVAEVDPAADFLAREQDVLAGLEDDLNPPAVILQTQHIENDFLASNGHVDAFEQEFQQDPIYSTSSNLAPDDFALPVEAPQDKGMGMRSSSPSLSTGQPAREEPEKIRKWREEQKTRLEEKDAEEERKKQELRDQARKELEEWYRHHDDAIAKTRSSNREASKSAEKELVATPTGTEGGQEWERIAKLCDFNPKSSRNSKDVSRMRSIILQLKQTPPVRPTA